jgi:hypothetical protein
MWSLYRRCSHIDVDWTPIRVAFATCSAMPDGYPDDHETARALSAEWRSWDDESVDWERYDRVVIRSTWNYTSRVYDFVSWCPRVGPERLRNPPELVAFNVDKRYLVALEAPSVPMQLLAPGEGVPELRGEVVVKPNVSSGARNTGRFGPATHELAAELVRRIQASGRTALVQPYMESVDRHGEVALVFLGGALSHVLRKQALLRPDEVAPATDGELGVAQAMLREDLVVAGRCEERERAFAQRVLDEVAERFGPPLYARIDLVWGERGEPLLLELEAVEPDLYLRLVPGASRRFAEAVLAG